MKTSKSICFAISFVLMASCAMPENNPITSEEHTQGDRMGLFGGEPLSTGPSFLQSVVGITYPLSSETRFCSGTKVTGSGAILTAGHCTPELEQNQRDGLNILYPDKTISTFLKDEFAWDFKRHPHYSSTSATTIANFEHDLGVFFIHGPMDISLSAGNKINLDSYDTNARSQYEQFAKLPGRDLQELSSSVIPLPLNRSVYTAGVHGTEELKYLPDIGYRAPKDPNFTYKKLNFAPVGGDDYHKLRSSGSQWAFIALYFTKGLIVPSIFEKLNLSGNPTSFKYVTNKRVMIIKSGANGEPGSASNAHGDSGGPMFSDNGELLAVVSSGVYQPQANDVDQLLNSYEPIDDEIIKVINTPRLFGWSFSNLETSNLVISDKRKRLSESNPGVSVAVPDYNTFVKKYVFISGSNLDQYKKPGAKMLLKRNAASTNGQPWVVPLNITNFEIVDEAFKTTTAKGEQALVQIARVEIDGETLRTAKAPDGVTFVMSKGDPLKINGSTIPGDIIPFTLSLETADGDKIESNLILDFRRILPLTFDPNFIILPNGQFKQL